MSKTRFSKWSYRVAVGSRVFGGWDKYKGKQVKRRRNQTRVTARLSWELSFSSQVVFVISLDVTSHSVWRKAIQQTHITALSNGHLLLTLKPN